MATKTKKKERFAPFLNLVEAVAEELYTKAEWQEAIDNDGPLQMTHLEMLSEVYDKAFERDPEAFGNIQWINSEYGMPAWVRPGVEWSPN